jgi:hypothetical protein
MRQVLEETLERLYKANILSLNVTGDFIVRSRDRNCYTVRSFINVLVDVLDCLY